MFTDFIKDKDHHNMYVTGAAGTGKTTNLAKDVKYCMDNEVPYVVCAYTHKACEILESKLPPGAIVKTLHAFIGKRPTINMHATKLAHVSVSTKTGITDEEPIIMFLDEYSMIGKRDEVDIVAAKIKVVWLGDSHQLPPVGDEATIIPNGPYQMVLTKQYRNDNPLQIPLRAIISFLEGAKPAPLKPVSDFFIRGCNLVQAYKMHDDVIILAYTNQRVQELNAEVQGYKEPKPDDMLFSPTDRKQYKLIQHLDSVESIKLPRQEEELTLGSKYRTLEGLIQSKNCAFMEVENEYGNVVNKAVIFGHHSYNVAKQRLQQAAVESNLAIEREFKLPAAGWARVHSNHKLAKGRAKAWREYLSFEECVICLDFTHAMTVHKSQGSTFEVVCLDTKDLEKAMRNFMLYLKLMYVGISRASKKVYTS